MNQNVVLKDEERELPVPVIWRSALKQIVDSFVQESEPPTAVDAIVVDPIASDEAKINRQNIKDYPDPIGPLAEHSWATSIYIWMDGYWDVLVDLSTSYGETSDLVLHAKVRESGNQYIIKPGLIYVP
ncbi:DUF7668 domain-containing protein [Hyphococcus sp.]|jgi:hypothetical protein|uniref:DUF7668 domain-containing protein n=1 Tax=Hyphococcus sp. TaxID=2038636 RepID=UPI003D0B1129